MPRPRNFTARASRRTAALAWALWALAALSHVPVAWLDSLIRQANRPDLLLLAPGAVPFWLATASAATIGMVVATRQPRHPVGWLLLGLGASVPAAGAVQGYVRYGLLARPGALPAVGYVAPHTVTLAVGWLVCIGFILLLTPTGSLPSPRWRRPARIAAAAPVVFAVSQVFGSESWNPQYGSFTNPLAIPALTSALRVTAAVAAATAGLTLVSAAASLVVRYHRARGVQRQQLRWVAFAAVLAMAATAVALPAVVANMTSTQMLDLTVGVCVALLPLAIGAAILRYRLYDLDRIISRTLAYGALTALLGGGYAAVVLGLGQLLHTQGSGLVVAGATLAVAAAFHPVRRRVQETVDRRFNRRRYDAAQTIEAFSTRLRQQVDPDALTTDLLAVVDQTMRPTRVTLWLRPPPRPESTANGTAVPSRTRTW